MSFSFETAAHIAAPLRAVPQIVTEGDAPRARKSDRRTSHQAADTSQGTLQETKVRVLKVLLEGPATGTELNQRYRLKGGKSKWAKVAPDTPRKRAGELAADGYLEITEERRGANHQPEAVYALSEKGRKVVTLGPPTGQQLRMSRRTSTAVS